MPYVNHHGVRIHYEVEGQGPPLVLHHGITNNLQGWRLHRYTDALKDDYRLILVDARGHGDSEKPHETHAYSPALMTGDVVAVLNDLGVKKAHFWGYSMGGRIGFLLTKYHPARFSAYIIGGISPFPRRSAAEQQLVHRITRGLRVGADEGPEAYLDYWETLIGQKLPVAIRQRMLGNDYRALYALVQHIARWPYTDERVSKITMPCLLYVGERDAFYDRVKEAAKHIPDARFVSLPGLGHNEAFFRADLILPYAKRFLSRVTSLRNQITG